MDIKSLKKAPKNSNFLDKIKWCKSPCKCFKNY